MGEPLQNTKYYGMEEYLEMEKRSDFRSEYVEGEVFAMAGGSCRHSAICSNLHRSIGNRLEGKNCTVFDSNLKLAIPQSKAFVYPDLMVVCGPIELFENQPDILQNPILIIEVLSPSTELFDRGKKFSYYRSIASLQEYALISQEAPFAEVFLKRNDKSWLFSVTKGEEEYLILQSLACQIPLKEIYLKVMG
ncbi:Uma2 family endonuclease [Desulfatirhabdium butyrativorans]|uniref:Uma2 family endonuclease n=1 Tax=Desulfatirhabdium butyrativorans TaxID=340467 RepID=UPI00042A89D6|nr:Uma2 family endonuclease [Desulfatirhabdium butyrativorans]